MLLVDTYISMSQGKGFGLFAKHAIKKGKKYWIRNENFDKIVSSEELSSFKKLSRDFYKTYGFLENSGNWYLCLDHARFSNHSLSPNTCNHFDSKGLLKYCTVIKNIQAGEEILIDYTQICLTCKDGVSFTELR